MAFTLIANTGAASTDTNSVTTGAINTTGATLLVVVFVSFEPSVAPTLSDSKGNTWTGLTAQSETGLVRERMFYCVSPTVGSGHTFTVSGTASFPSVCVSAWSGVDTGSPLDQQSGSHNGSTLTQSPGSLAPANNNSLIVTGSGDGLQATDRSVNGGFTITNQNAGGSGQCFGTGMAYLIQTTAAASNPQWTYSTTVYCGVTQVIFNASASTSAVITEQNLPSNHNGNITVHLIGTGTSWTSSTTWTPSGVTGWSVASKTQVDGTHYTVVLTPPAAATPPSGSTGTLTLTEGVTGSVTATTTVGTPSFVISPTSGATGTTPTLTITGTNTIWTTETPSGLFTVTGGTGASIGTPTVTTNTACTAVLTVGSSAGTLTITDTSTGATRTFTASSGIIAISNPVQYQWKGQSGGSAPFTVAGTYTGSPSTIEYSTDGGSNWFTLDASPSAGNYTGSISLNESLTDYTIQTRFSSSPGVTASVANIAVVGVVLVIDGQSNEDGRLTNNQTAYPITGADANRKKTTSGYAVLSDPTGNDGPATGSYALVEANVLSALLGRRVGVVNFAVGGTTLAQWQKTTGSGYYEVSLAATQLVAPAGATVIVRMGPCETDAINGTSTATYHAGIVTWVGNWLSDVPGSIITWRTLQHINPASASQPNQDAINAAILQAAGSTPAQATGDVDGLVLMEVRSYPAYPGDDFHWLTDQQGGGVGGIAAGTDYAALNPPTPGGTGGANLLGNGTLVSS